VARGSEIKPHLMQLLHQLQELFAVFCETGKKETTPQVEPLKTLSYKTWTPNEAKNTIFSKPSFSYLLLEGVLSNAFFKTDLYPPVELLIELHLCFHI
jgi:hypothetical protein